MITRMMVASRSTFIRSPLSSDYMPCTILASCLVLMDLQVTVATHDQLPDCQWIHITHMPQLQLSIPVSVQVRFSEVSSYDANSTNHRQVLFYVHMRSYPTLNHPSILF